MDMKIRKTKTKITKTFRLKQVRRKLIFAENFIAVPLVHPEKSEQFKPGIF